ncbi:hypothetical protein [Actinomycetospora sp. CA-084318]|uniref:hypothetical protein n=1 Tax=Actinomycetospora sp. CA-084318 TaxID=3239892 RepID=UPI003D993DED
MPSNGTKDSIDASTTLADPKTAKAPDPSGAKVAEPNAAKEPAMAAESLRELVTRVRQRYDTQTTWTVGALVAVGTLVFGSLPFANAAGQDFFPLFGDTLGGGLFLSAIGIGLVLWARSRTLEPQDASLGELQMTLARFDASKMTWWKNGFLRWFRPTVDANYEIYRILESDDANAHLGPGISGRTPAEKVKALVRRIGELESTSLDHTKDVAGDEAGRALARTALADVASALKQRAADAGSPSRWLELQNGHIGRLAESGRQQVAKGRGDAELEIYLGHRELLLAESAIAQVRGTFRAGRMLLLVGGLLTLLGAAIYTADLPAKAGAPAATPPALGTATPITVAVRPGNTRLDSGCRGTLAGYRLAPTGEITQAGRDGPFTVFVTSPATCTGQIEFAEDEADGIP